MPYAVHVYNHDGASGDQEYRGPFRSYDAANRFAQRVDALITKAGNNDGTLGATVIALGHPRIGELRDGGWFDGATDDDE